MNYSFLFERNLLTMWIDKKKPLVSTKIVWLRNLHSSPKETQAESIHFSCWSWVTDPDTGSSKLYIMSGSLIYTLPQKKCNLAEPAFLLVKSVWGAMTLVYTSKWRTPIYRYFLSNMRTPDLIMLIVPLHAYMHFTCFLV